MNKVGIGTNSPTAKLTVVADAGTIANDTLFVVRNKNGEPVFAVFPEGGAYVNCRWCKK